MIIFHNILQCDHLVILCFEMAVGHFYAHHRKQLFVILNNFAHKEEVTLKTSSYSVERNQDNLHSNRHKGGNKNTIIPTVWDVLLWPQHRVRIKFY